MAMREEAGKDCNNQPNGEQDKDNPMAICRVRAVAVDRHEVERRGSCRLWVIFPCREEEIICRRFLQKMRYWGAREQGKCIQKSDREHPGEVRGVHLGCGELHFLYAEQWEYYLFC